MKKTFPLHAPGKADARVIEGIKHDVRKYVQRERRKTLPEGFDQWDFACKVGADPTTADAKNLQTVGTAIDDIVKTGVDSLYVEVIAVAGHRAPRASAVTGALVASASPAPTLTDSAPAASTDLPTHLL